MKGIKKLIAIIAVLGVLGASGVAYAADFRTPAEITAGLTGKTVTELNTQRAGGKTYGAIAKEAGVLEDFQKQMLEQKKAVLDQRVTDGTMTQEQADEIYNNIKNNQANCDGTGNGQIGKKMGAGFGKAAGLGQGNGQGIGNGQGQGNGQGMGSGVGMRNGTCNGTGLNK